VEPNLSLKTPLSSTTITCFCFIELIVNPATRAITPTNKRGTKMVIKINDFFRTRVKYSLLIMIAILFIEALTFTLILKVNLIWLFHKLASSWGIFHQSDEYIIQGGQNFFKAQYFGLMIEVVLQYGV